MEEILNKFTTYKYLLEILKNGLYFSDGKTWPDKNDTELLDLFNAKSGKTARVVCLMEEDETIYHWQSFANGSCEQEVCCIEFDKEALLSLYNKKDGFFCGNVEYKSIDEVVFDRPEKLLFTKRLPYRYEKEYRIVHISADKKKPLKPDIDEFRKSITKISMSGRLSQEEYNQRKAYLIKKYSLSESQINQSTIERNPIWINKAKVQSSHLDFSKDMGCQLMNLCAKANSSDYVYRIKVERLYSSTIQEQSTIVTIHNNGYVVAMGAIQILDDDRIEEIKKYYFEICLSPNDLEIGCFFVRDDYKNEDLLKRIVENLLKYYESVTIFSIVEVDEKEIQTVLIDEGFEEMGNNGNHILYRKSRL